MPIHRERYYNLSVVVGNTEDAHGREVQVKISVTADQDEWDEIDED